MHKGNGPPKLIRMVDVLRLLTFGWYFATCLGVGLVGGLLIDRWLKTAPWFLLAGLLLGTAAGFYGMFKMLMPVYQGKGDRGSGGKPPA